MTVYNSGIGCHGTGGGHEEGDETGTNGTERGQRRAHRELLHCVPFDFFYWLRVR